MNVGIHTDNYLNIKNEIHYAMKLKAHNLQVFLGSKTLTTLREKFKPSVKEIKEIKDLLKSNKICLYVHGMLRINFCNDPVQKRYHWGLENLLYDMNLGHKLGARAVIIHAGHYKTKNYEITKNKCYTHFIQSLIYVLDHSKTISIYIETPALKTNTIINSLQEFGSLFRQIPEKYKKRIGVCVDTCHIFVSGYDISTQKGVKQYFKEFDKYIGIKHLKLIHFNDSLGELNSHVNRHASIGKGYIFKKKKEGLIELLKHINDYKIPIILETNKETFDKNIKIIKKYKENNNK